MDQSRSREQETRARIAARLILPILAIIVLFAILTQPSGVASAVTPGGSPVAPTATVMAVPEGAVTAGPVEAGVESAVMASGSASNPFVGEVMGIALLGGTVMVLAGLLVGQTRLSGSAD